jgi:hypothetical protein
MNISDLSYVKSTSEKVVGGTTTPKTTVRRLPSFNTTFTGTSTGLLASGMIVQTGGRATNTTTNETMMNLGLIPLGIMTSTKNNTERTSEASLSITSTGVFLATTSASGGVSGNA